MNPKGEGQQGAQQPIKKTEQQPLKARQRIGNFYNFKISDDKLVNLEKIGRKKTNRYFVTGIIFGFFTEYLLGNTKIYSNAVDRATMRRLNAKLKEDEKIGLIKAKKERRKSKEQTQRKVSQQ